MTGDDDEQTTRHPLRDADADRAKAEHVPDTPQTRAPAYRLAFNDDDFMCRDELRPVRLQLELLKPEIAGRTRDRNRPSCCSVARASPHPRTRHTARTKTLADLSQFYDEAREFARLMTLKSIESDGRENVIVTGGGPGRDGGGQSRCGRCGRAVHRAEHRAAVRTGPERHMSRRSCASTFTILRSARCIS